MKIALVTHVYFPNIGGVENYVFRLFRDLTAAGDNTYILTSDIGISKEKPIDKSNKIIYFHALPVLFRNPFTFGLAIHLLKNEYNIIHAHSIHAFPTLIALTLKKRSRFIVTAHGVSPDNSNLLSNFIWKLYVPVAKYICRKSDRVVVLGNSEKRKLIELADLDPNKIEVIYNGIDIPIIPGEVVIERFKSNLGLKEEKIVLFTGRIVPIKNPELLLKAFSIVHEKIDNVKLLMVGPLDPKYRYNLMNMANKLSIEKDLILTGELSQNELFASYAISDIFVSLGAWEGLPTTMLEAMFFSKPCIMFNSGGVKEVITDGETGFVIDKEDVNEISEKMIFLLINEEARVKMGEKAHSEILSKYLWSAGCNKMRQIYSELSSHSIAE